MSALDKSLDDIISTGRKSFKSRRVSRGSAGKVGKKVGSAAAKKPIVTFKKPQTVAVAAKQPAAVDLSYATKVVVYGLPKDIKLDAIKVGGVQNIALSYNEKGQFKGIATIIFKTNKSATLAVDKYNGAPIDGGNSKLKLELIVDPTKKPLTSRIAPNKVVSSSKLVAAKAQAKANLRTKQKAAAKSQQQKKKSADGKSAKSAKPAKRTKKTVEQLDQEMADYFEN